VENDIAQYAGVVDENVNAAKSIERGFDDRLRVFRIGDRECRRNRGAAGFFDRVDRLLRRTSVAALALQAGTDVANNDLCTFLRKQHGNAAPDTASRAGDDGGFARDHVCHFGLTTP
jgi:hypothetical protein